MKDSNTASDIDYQSMVKNIIDDFTSPSQIATEDTPEASNDAYINGLLLLFCKNLEMKITQLSVEEKQTLKEIFSRSNLKLIIRGFKFLNSNTSDRINIK